MRRKNPYLSVTVSIELITPDIAKEWLKKNSNNFRKPTSRTVVAYRKAMSAGEFGLSHDAIGFSTDGQLYNGQHRLLACIASGQPFYNIVARNMPSRSEVQTDVGSPRTLAQILNRTGAIDCACKTTAASCRDACGAFKGLRNYTSAPRGDVQVYEIEEFCLNNRELISKWRSIVKPNSSGVLGLSRRKVLSLSLIAGAGGDKHGILEDFVTKLITGLNTDPSEPVAALRRKLEQHIGRGSRMSDKSQWAALVAAWNKHRKGLDVRNLRVPDEVQEIIPA